MEPGRKSDPGISQGFSTFCNSRPIPYCQQILYCVLPCRISHRKQILKKKKEKRANQQTWTGLTLVGYEAVWRMERNHAGAGMQSIRAWWSRGVNEVRHPDKTIFCFLYRWNLLREIKRCCEVDFATFGHYQVSCFPHASSSYAKLTVSLQLQTSSLIPGSWLGLAPTLRLKTLIIHVFKKSFKKYRSKSYLNS